MRALRAGALLLCGSVALSGCISMNLQYTAEVEQGGKELSAVYQDTVSTTGHALACVLTGFLYGGWCWAYLAMPFAGTEEDFRMEARARIKEKLRKNKKKVRFHDERVDRTGWNDRYTMLQIWDEEEDDAVAETRTDRQGKTHDLDEKEKDEDFGTMTKEQQKRRLLEGVARLERGPARRGFTFGADAGTSFSPHGVGVTAGYRWDPFQVAAGYGFLSKKGVLGNPVSLELTYMLRDGTMLTAGVNRYEGHAERRVRYSEGYDYETDVYWNISYAQLGLGYNLLHSMDKSFELYARGGVGMLVYSRINADNPEHGNIGSPQGIVIDEDVIPDSAAGAPPDWGPFFLLGAYYVVH